MTSVTIKNKGDSHTVNKSTDLKQSLKGSSYDSPSRQDRRHLGFLESEEPEMIIPDQVEIKGDIEYDRYLYVDGSFEGNIITDHGNLFVGSNGVIISDLKAMGVVVVEGKVIGSIEADRLVVRGHASIQGDVTCSSVEMGPQSTMIGQMKSVFDPAEATVRSPKKGETTQIGRNVMLLLDPQVDFHKGGSCPVKGSDISSESVSNFISYNKDGIEEIFVGLDSHHRMHISHSVFWTNAYGESPLINTQLSYQAINDCEWTPRDQAQEIQEYVLNYAKELENKKRMAIHIWPEHCLIGSPGHAVVPSINKALQEWAEHTLNTVTYIMKGMNCLTEMYSALCAEVPIKTDQATCLDKKLIARLEEADRVIVCGQSLSHSVNFTCRDLIENWSSHPSKLHIVLDGCSCIAGFENEAAAFISDMKKVGVTITSFAELDLTMPDSYSR